MEAPNSEATPKNTIQKIDNPTNVQHITHVTWSNEKGFQINTDDEELAKLLRKTLTGGTDFKTEEDVIKYVSNEFETTKQDDDIYISYPFNIRHDVHCSRNEDSRDFSIMKNGNLVKLHIERFLKKHGEDK
ncbi:P21-Rho-binding domain [Popillia japonica]|uniref:P21-Rho-binding domain n=1 Tax=Popillia japonica TaxID=7064 RepID=A0AAW1IFH3_POPJA